MRASIVTAGAFVDALHQGRTESELRVIRQRLAPGDGAIGMRMRDLFDTARAAAATMPLEEIDALLDNSLYEARMGAVCILDFRAKRKRVTEEERRAYYGLYLARLDRITTWDMVDRGAPSVVGGHLVGRSRAPLVGFARHCSRLTRTRWCTRQSGSR